jgi:hypothetical protein
MSQRVHYKKIQRSLKITFAVSAGFLAMASLSEAIQLADGTTYFAGFGRIQIYEDDANSFLPRSTSSI